MQCEQTETPQIPRDGKKVTWMDTAADEPAKSNGWAKSLFGSPLLLGGLLTFGFYALIPMLPVYRELVIRYFCSHPLEYATAGLFFVGISTLGLKAARLVGERQALALRLLDSPNLDSSADAVERVAHLENKLHSMPRAMQHTYLSQRVGEICDFVRSRRSSDGLDEHLKYLAEIAAEKLHGSYALVRTVTWAVPILGFLGTVIGITIAIANVTPEQLDTSLSEVTGGLAVAFDTTALALALSMVLVFSAFVVERSEQQLLVRVEEYAMRRLATLFPLESKPQQGLLASAESQAAHNLLERSEQLVNAQTEMWQDAMEALRQRWMQTLEGQQTALESALTQGMSATLEDHATQLSQIRGEFLHGYQTVANNLASMHQEWTSQNDQLVNAVSREVAGWQTDMQETTGALTRQSDQLQSQGETLLRIVEQEEQLGRLQNRLTENLQAIQSAEVFEETLHSLSAAVHLLTARAKPKAA